jgi:gliding motility-associated-like protein
VTYSDVANNPGTAVTSTTNSSTVVVDTAVPTLGTVSISSSNTNTSQAKVGDVITVNIVAGEAIQTPTVTVAGQVASVTGTGSTYAATYTVTSNTPQGTASISVTFSDVANNLGTAVTSTTNSSTVVVDTAVPTLYTVDWIPASIDNANFRNVGFTLTNAELGATYSYIISSGTSSLTASGTVTNSTQVIGNINTSTLRDGIITLSLKIIDQAGNSGLVVTDTINKATNGGPTGTPTPITLSQNDPDQTINLLNGITDAEGDPLTVSNVTISYSIENVVTNQPVVINSTLLTKFQDVVSTSDLTGTNLFIEMSKSKFLNGSQKGQINIAYVVTDGNNNLNANAVLNIIGANDQPTGSAVTLNQVVINGQNMGIPLTEGVGVSTNVPGIDPDDDSVTYTLDQNSSVSNGQFVFNPDGSFNFLPDANYYGEQEFDYYIKDQSGVLNGPYKVKIVIAENPDIDGIPSKLEEVAPNGGDVNGDGIPDRKQNNITNVPLGSFADYQAGIDWANGVPGATRPSTSKVGSLLIGSLPGGKSGLDSLDLDPNAKFRNVALLPTPNIANTDRQFSSDLYQFTIEGLLTNAADTLSPRLPLRDLDPTRPGLQVRAVLEFPVGMKGSTYLKQNKAGEWKSFKDDQNLATYDDGATLIDLDNDPSTIERIVLTFTDGAFGDKDTLVNNSISDPGGLGIIKPVIDDATLPTRAEGVATATTLFNVFERNSRLDVDEEGQKLYYTIDSTNNSAAVRAAVKIDSLTGVITVRDAGGFDYESFVDANGLAKFNIVVKATDTDGNFDLATFTQTITNVDEYPRIISGKTVSYREKQPTTVAVIKVQTLPDYQDLTSFSILSGLDGAFFTIDPATGVLRFKNSPNYDDKPVYTLDIQSQDLSGKTDHAVFTVNIIDIDADNDGILDDEEIGPDPLNPIDTDKDGIPDYKDTDSDGDGIPDLLESKSDTDKDGIPDYLDTDSDGDGILDKIEAGPNPLKPLDSDGDGIPDFRELDADNDGYLDSYEKSIDTDKDGIPDFQDTDSDGDGILDKVEDDLDFGNIKDCDHDGIENRIDPDVCDLILPQIITPNGDGMNDVLKIPGIMRLQPNHITIINRWGAVVYDAENYQNTWGGTGDSGELPDGTYYYVVDFKGAKPTISNFIYLDRTGK